MIRLGRAAAALDEPTNHLDAATFEAVDLELRAVAGTLVVVSYDRAFLAAFGVGRRLEVCGGRLRGCAMMAS